MIPTLSNVRVLEAQACAEAVCPACAGNYPDTERRVTGPNAAGNYLHPVSRAPDAIRICCANGIWARLRAHGLDPNRLSLRR